mmetsp:Transcript_42053/g.84438  ORF Transcript_42053/g.84438 Transcript_42053/m.84438 type:complete len:221 (-) Transcript_42053:70-732(-)
MAMAQGHSQDECFQILYGFERSQALSGGAWAWDFWHLAVGDSALELILKVKEVHWWQFSSERRATTFRDMIFRVLDAQPQTTAAKIERLERAVRRFDAAMNSQPLPPAQDVDRRLRIARHCLHVLRELLATEEARRKDEEDLAVVRGATEPLAVVEGPPPLVAIADAECSAQARVDELEVLAQHSRAVLDRKLEKANNTAVMGVGLVAPRRWLLARWLVA